MTKRVMVMLALVAAMAFATQALADDKVASAKPAAQTLNGEILDMSCYIGHEAKGAKHGATCGTKCVANGTPMGLLTRDGKVHVLCLNHDDAAPFNACKAWVGQMVDLTGTLGTRGGISAIDVQGAKLAAAAPAAK